MKGRDAGSGGPVSLPEHLQKNLSLVSAMHIAHRGMTLESRVPRLTFGMAAAQETPRARIIS